MSPPAQARIRWQRINDANDWEFALPQGHTIEIGPDGAKGYSVVYVVRDDTGTVEEVPLEHQPDQEAAMAAAERVPVCATCGLPIHESTERGTGWDHMQWDDESHDVLPRGTGVTAESGHEPAPEGAQSQAGIENDARYVTKLEWGGTEDGGGNLWVTTVGHGDAIPPTKFLLSNEQANILLQELLRDATTRIEPSA